MRWLELALKKAERELGDLVGLGQYRDAGLHQDLVPTHHCGFFGNINITYSGVGRREIGVLG